MTEADPLALFEAWYREAVDAGAAFADAMALATASPDGRPSVRLVLYKGRTANGIRFFTNYESRKGRELEENPRAAVVFHWPVLGRQVRMEGPVRRVSRAESEQYFAVRPRDSQIGACVSPQSRPIASRAQLEQAAQELEQRLAGQAVQCPENWGGYLLEPDAIELWVNRGARLHDRTLYVRGEQGWDRVLLAP